MITCQYQFIGQMHQEYIASLLSNHVLCVPLPSKPVLIRPLQLLHWLLAILKLKKVCSFVTYLRIAITKINNHTYDILLNHTISNNTSYKDEVKYIKINVSKHNEHQIECLYE